MRIQIFNVERGQCCLIRCPNGKRVMIDAGHNSSTGWRPSKHLREQNISEIENSEIEKLIVSNYDEDHVSDLPNVSNGSHKVHIASLLRNRSITPDILRKLKKDGGMGDGIKCLLEMMEKYTYPSPHLDLGEVERRSFYNSYPDFTDTNNLSVVTFVSYAGFTILFPGDLEVAGWKKLLRQPDFQKALSGVNVMVTSHHGRENGYCKEVFDYAKNVALFVVSDGEKQYETQDGMVQRYGCHAKGKQINGEERRVLTTRRDGNITIGVNNTGGYSVSTETQKVPVTT